jgi:uncharacterized membrane protein (UPF0136 family)
VNCKRISEKGRGACYMNQRPQIIFGAKFGDFALIFKPTLHRARDWGRVRIMQWPRLLLYIYGVLLIFGGLMGYMKARSMPSLVAGLVCGLIAIFLGYDYVWHFAPHCAFILALVLIILMGRRYLRTRKPMPALLIVVLSVIVAIVQVYILLTLGAGTAPL